MNNDLKNCPFCESKAEFFQSPARSTGHGESSDDVGVRCTGCGVSFSESSWADHEVQKRQDKCAQKWNKRAYFYA